MIVVVVADFDDGKVIAVAVEGAVVVVVVFAVVNIDVGGNDLHSLHLRGPIRFQKTHAHETRKKSKSK